MIYSLAILFFIQSLVYVRAKGLSITHSMVNLDMVYELNGRKNICIVGNVITLQIILRNIILGNNNLFKVTST